VLVEVRVHVQVTGPDKTIRWSTAAAVVGVTVVAAVVSSEEASRLMQAVTRSRRSLLTT
jgi:hypothetical protein